MWTIFNVFIEFAAKSLQSGQTLCYPMDGSPPGSPVPGILQVRTLEWGAIAFSAKSYILRQYCHRMKFPIYAEWNWRGQTSTVGFLPILLPFRKTRAHLQTLSLNTMSSCNGSLTFLNIHCDQGQWAKWNNEKSSSFLIFSISVSHGGAPQGAQ